ncbi:MAG: hypothetical protein JNL70_04825 [Saprospiraceae bacterium]|nr:hypothetical protein [Saprospiraceae bacterium]
MNKIENEKYMNARSVIEYVNHNKERAQRVPAFVQLIEKLEAQLNLISAAETQSKQDTTGSTKQKNKNKDEVKAAITRLSQLMLAYADAQDNIILENKLKAIRTKLSRAKQAEFPTQCREVLTEAKTLNGSLAAYGYTMEDMLDLEAQVDTFDSKTPQTTQLLGQKKAGTKAKRLIFTKVNKITNKQIKNAAAAFVGTDDEFYSSVMDCIKMKKRATPPPTFIKLIFNSSDNQRGLLPVQDIKNNKSLKSTKIVETNKAGKMNKKGEMFFKLSKSGTFSLNIPLEDGSVKVIPNIIVKRGQTSEVEVAI